MCDLTRVPCTQLGHRIIGRGAYEFFSILPGLIPVPGDIFPGNSGNMPESGIDSRCLAGHHRGSPDEAAGAGGSIPDRNSNYAKISAEKKRKGEVLF